jgi:O-antigen/teichoic acid export membrane protein
VLPRWKEDSQSLITQNLLSSNLLARLARWTIKHPARAGTIAGWYQQGCSVVAALIVVPLVLKVLGSQEAGLWFCFQNMLAIINLTDFGLSFVVARQVSFSMHARSGISRGRSDFLATREGWLGVMDIYFTSRALFGRVGLLGLVILVLLYELILPHGKLLTHATTQTRIAWYLLGGAALFSLYAKPHLAVLDGLAKVHLARFLVGTTQLLTGLGVILAMLAGGHLPEMASVVMVLSFVQYLAAQWLLRRTSKDLRRPTDLPGGLWRQFLRIALPMGVLNVGSFLISSIQVPLLGFLLGPHVVPGFFLAQRIGQTLNQAVMHVVAPQLPLFTREVALQDSSVARRRLRRTVAIVTGSAFILNLVFYFGSPKLADWWVGSGSYVDSTTLVVLSLDYWLCTSAVAWAQFVLAAGSNPFVWSTLISGLLSLVLNWVLVPRYSITGAALSGLITGLLLNYWYAVYRGVRCSRGLKTDVSSH